MACDGFWNCVKIQLVCEYISLKLKESLNISKIISDLFDHFISETNKSISFLKLANIGTDNMSCILIQFKH